jgi:hypothetical protein
MAISTDILTASILANVGDKSLKTLESILSPEQRDQLKEWEQNVRKVLAEMKEEREWVINLAAAHIIGSDLDENIKIKALWALNRLRSDKDLRSAFLQHFNLPLLVNIGLMIFTVIVAMMSGG